MRDYPFRNAYRWATEIKFPRQNFYIPGAKIYNGWAIYVEPNLPVKGYRRKPVYRPRKRTLLERLRWRFWIHTIYSYGVLELPVYDIYVVGNTIYVHPSQEAMVKELVNA